MPTKKIPSHPNRPYYFPAGSGKQGEISEEQIVDGSLLARLADDETVTGAWHFGNYLDFDEVATPGVPAADTMRLWAADSQGFPTLNYMNSDGLNLQLGRDRVIVVRNTSGAPISVGQVVHAVSSTGNVLTVDLADASDPTKMPALGIAIEDMADNAFGRVMAAGDVGGFDTSAFVAGDKLWVSGSTPGALTKVQPTGSTEVQIIGIATKIASGSGGVVTVMVGSAVEGLGDIGNVNLGSEGSGELLLFDGTDWINQTLAEAGISAVGHTHAATDIVSGTLADARLSSNVPLLDAANVFTGAQQFPGGGDVQVGDGTSSATIKFVGSVNSRGFAIFSGSSASSDRRWQFIGNSDAETGSNAGSNIAFFRYSDAGSLLGTPLAINRATGIVSFAEGLDIGGGQTIADSDNVPLLDAANVFTAAKQTINPSTGLPELEMGGTSSAPRITFQNAGGVRWKIRVGTDDNDGDDDGGELIFEAFDDSGSSLGNLFVFDRSTTANINVSLPGAVILGRSIGSYTGKLSFFSGLPVAKKTVTGSKGGNAALASLLTQLAAYGLVTDSTT